MRAVIAATAAVVVAGCGARVGGDVVDADDDPSDARADARPGIPDAPPLPPDAAPCTGGAANAVDGTTCYEAFLAPLEDWASAQSSCAGRGGALVRIDTAAENAIVAGLAGGNRAWIGGNDLVTENTFLWTDGTTFAVTYTNWRTGEPNNGNGNFQEDCALIESGATWDDRPCDDAVVGATVPGSYAYVCERSL